MKIRILAALLALILPALTGCGQVTVTVEAAPLAAEGKSTTHMEDPLPPSYDIYETFGLEYDGAEDALYFGGKRVRYFFDGVDTGTGGQISRWSTSTAWAPWMSAQSGRRWTTAMAA